MYYSTVSSVLFGVAIGDALGLSHEFKSRDELLLNPVRDIMGHGMHDQPRGTFSDDTSLTLCLAQSLTKQFDINDVAFNFSLWLKHGYWSAHGVVFDIGSTTLSAIEKYIEGYEPTQCGGKTIADNGNGSLMRISPLVFVTLDKSLSERFELVKAVSSITHRHIRSITACFCYVEFLRKIILGVNKFDAYQSMQIEVLEFLIKLGIGNDEIDHFNRILKCNVYEFPLTTIESSGYVIHTLEASLTCFLTTSSFSEAVLKAVNLGEDTDTTGAVTGALAGAMYGYNSIPKQWLKELPKFKEIKVLCEKLELKYFNL